MTIGLFVDTSKDRIVSGQPDSTVRPRKRNIAKPLAVYCHGAGGNPTQMLGNDGFPGLGTQIAGIANALDLCVVSVGYGLYSFGNTSARQAIADAITWGRANMPVHQTAPVVLLGASMGGNAALTHYALNPTKVACVIGWIPLVDIQQARVDNTLGLRPNIDLAWGVTYPAALPANSNPNASDMRALLNGKKMYLAYASDDTVSANIAAFATATGATIANVGAGGHTDASIGAASASAIQSFIASNI